VKPAIAINDLLKVMARLRSPSGCPWDREQDHMTLRRHAIEEVYELIDAIEAGDDHELAEELGDLLLQVVFHCQMAKERGAFDFEKVSRHLVDKLVRRHPHVFGKVKVKDVDEVWANWESIKRAEKHGTRHARPSALDGIPKHLPALLRAEKLLKKARKAVLAMASRLATSASQRLPNNFPTGGTRAAPRLVGGRMWWRRPVAAGPGRKQERRKSSRASLVHRQAFRRRSWAQRAIAWARLASGRDLETNPSWGAGCMRPGVGAVPRPARGNGRGEEPGS
jgi:NTP pyrophosphatase (non-canonical NTP hydrolase)